MASYEVSASILSEEAQSLQTVAGDLSALSDRLINLHIEEAVSFDIAVNQRRLSSDISSISTATLSLGRVLNEIAGTYINAERIAFSDDDLAIDRIISRQSTNTNATFQQAQDALFFNDLIMPDWLQARVTQYTQNTQSNL